MLYLAGAVALALFATADNPKAADASEQDKIVCKKSKIPRTGSHMNSKRECKRQSEWELIEEQSQRELKQIRDKMIDPTPIPGAPR